MKQLLRSFLRSRGYEIRRHSEARIVDFLKSRNVAVVFDVGANTGQFAEAIRRGGYTDDIVSFEPVAATFQDLKARSARDPKWTVHNLALGAASGTAEINVSLDSKYSSLLPLSKAGAGYDQYAAVERKEQITVARLDDVVADYVGRKTFLKIDTQGFEKNVLSGASETLKTVTGVLMEAPLQHLYQDTWSFQDALGYMSERGFTLSQISTVNMRTDDPASILEVDCLFGRA